MENATPAIAKPSLSKKPSPSFRLRNGSLNALRLRRVFDLFDRNGDGEITLEEMASALDSLGLGADRSGLEAAVGGYIPAGAAGLRFDDFESLHRALGDALFGPIPEQVPDDDDEGDMKEAFRVFDEDGDGFISAAELQAVLKKLHCFQKLQNLPADQYSAFIILCCWQLWKRRNEVVFRDVHQNLRTIIISCRSEAFQWKVRMPKKSKMVIQAWSSFLEMTVNNSVDVI